MLSSISWSQYLSAVLFVSICYYTYVAYKYFRWEILGLIGIKRAETGTHSIPVTDFKRQLTAENHDDYLPKPFDETDISPLVNSFIDEVKAYLQAAGRQTTKQELLNSLQQVIQKYPVLLKADCKDELIQFLFNETNALYPDTVHQQEIQQLWPDKK